MNLITILKKDNYLFGILISIISIAVGFGLFWLFLFLISKTFYDDPKIFLFSFVPAILLMRWYFKLQYTKTAIPIVIILFISFLSYILILYNMGVFMSMK